MINTILNITGIIIGLTTGLVLVDTDHILPRLIFHSVHTVMFFLFFGISLYLFTIGGLIL